MQVGSLGQEDPPEDGMANHSSILSCKIPVTEKPGGLQSTGLQNQTLLKWLSMHAQFSSVQFSRSVVSDSLRPHKSQHARPSCPSPSPRVHSDSRPSSSWCHPAISSSVVPFSSCPQSLQASKSFPMSQFFAWGGQSTGASASASFLPNKSWGSSLSDILGYINYSCVF